MNKNEFLTKLRDTLSGLPQESIDDRIAFYAEMIDDRTEEGLSETEAVKSLGSIESITLQILDDFPLATLVREKVASKKKPGGGTVFLLCLGAPLWLPLLIAAFAVAFSLYISLWAVVISLWTAEVTLWGSALGGITGGIVFCILGQAQPGIALIGAALVCTGISVFGFYGCKAAAKGAVLLAKAMLSRTKRAFVGKGEVR